jgi:hypothetical protein
MIYLSSLYVGLYVVNVYRPIYGICAGIEVCDAFLMLLNKFKFEILYILSTAN